MTLILCQKNYQLNEDQIADKIKTLCPAEINIRIKKFRTLKNKIIDKLVCYNKTENDKQYKKNLARIYQ